MIDKICKRVVYNNSFFCSLYPTISWQGEYRSIILDLMGLVKGFHKSYDQRCLWVNPDFLKVLTRGMGLDAVGYGSKHAPQTSD